MLRTWVSEWSSLTRPSGRTTRTPKKLLCVPFQPCDRHMTLGKCKLHKAAHCTAGRENLGLLPHSLNCSSNSHLTQNEIKACHQYRRQRKSNLGGEHSAPWHPAPPELYLFITPCIRTIPGSQNTFLEENFY